MPRTDRIMLIVTPAGYSTRGQLFDGTVDGETIIRRSPTPLFDSARVLAAKGADPERQIEMRHPGSQDGTVMTIGGAAARTVQEGERTPTIRPWKPRIHAAWDSPMSFSEKAATTPPDQEERA